MCIDKQITVMQAYKEGKTIECKYKNNDDTWSESPEPTWNWRDCDYRVMQDSGIRPYTVEELLVAIQKHGPMVEYSEGCYASITGVYSSEPATVFLDGERDLDLDGLTRYTWQDGTPCGVIEKEQ